MATKKEEYAVERKALEAKYATAYKAVYAERAAVVSGSPSAGIAGFWLKVGG